MGNILFMLFFEALTFLFLVEYYRTNNHQRFKKWKFAMNVTCGTINECTQIKLYWTMPALESCIQYVATLEKPPCFAGVKYCIATVTVANGTSSYNSVVSERFVSKSF